MAHKLIKEAILPDTLPPAEAYHRRECPCLPQSGLTG